MKFSTLFILPLIVISLTSCSEHDINVVQDSPTTLTNKAGEVLRISVEEDVRNNVLPINEAIASGVPLSQIKTVVSNSSTQVLIIQKEKSFQLVGSNTNLPNFVFSYDSSTGTFNGS